MYQAIATHFKEELLTEMQSNYFSLAVDETHDADGKSCACIMVRLPDKFTGRIASKLLALLPVRGHSKGKDLFQLLQDHVFRENPQVEQHFMGVTTDQGANMVGSEAGLALLLIKKYPWATALLDLSHRYSLIVSRCIKVIDEFFPKDLKKIINYFQNNSHKARLAELSAKDLGSIEQFS